MAVKSIITIDVDDSSFQAFAKKFADYQDALKDAPKKWAEAGAASNDAAKGVGRMGAETAGVAGTLRKLSADNASITRNTKEQASAWGTMARNAGKFTSHVAEATKSLLRWGALTGLISGILGAGGLFGIDRLAIAAGNQRRNALGLGVTPGEARAFDVNYSRVVDPSAFLGGVNEALHDVTKRVSLYGAGLTENDIRGKDSAQVGAELIPQLKKIADATPDALLAQTLTARHLDQFITLQDFQRLKNTSPEELERYRQGFAKDQTTFQLPPGVLKAWQDLQVQFERAGSTVENAFIKGLVDLAPQFEHLSAAFTALIADVLGSKQVRVWIDELADGIKWLADNMDTPEFKSNVKGFADSIGDAAGSIGNFAKNMSEALPTITTVFKIIAGAGKVIASVFGPIMNGRPADPENPLYNDPDKSHEDNTPGYKQLQEYLKGHTTGRVIEPKEWSNHLESFNKIEKSQNLPPGLLNAVGLTESGGDPNAISPANAQGAFQFTPSAWAQYGNGGNPFDTDQSAAAAGRYYHALLQEFHGDVAKAAAGYNWGPANVEKDVAQYGDHWREHLPSETQSYVSKVTNMLAQQPNKPTTAAPASMNININNNTGGNAVVSASQLAY